MIYGATIFKNGETNDKMSFVKGLIKINNKTIGEFKSADSELIRNLGKFGIKIAKDCIFGREFKLVFGDKNEWKLMKYRGPVGVIYAKGHYLPTKFNKELRAKFFGDTKF